MWEETVRGLIAVEVDEDREPVEVVRPLQQLSIVPCKTIFPRPSPT
jgi:hypothetical protein